MADINGNDKITIIQWIDSRIEAIERVHQAEREADKLALVLQAREYERRLDDLNHAHAQARADTARFVSVEKFDAVCERMDKVEKWQASLDGRLLGAGAVITLISVGIGIVSHFWK